MEPSRVESIAAEHEHADRKADIFQPGVTAVEKVQVVAELAEMVARMKEEDSRVESTPVSIEAPTVGEYIPRNRAEKRARARPRKGGSPCDFRQMPVGSLDSLLRFRGR